MLGFGFYSFGFTNPETIDKLISREDLTIDELLDEDNIVQEIKGSSEKFGNYMGHHPEMIKNMLNYIIIEPDEIELDYKKCYKYPFIASEIFYSEIDGIINAFFDEKPGSGLNQENPSEHEHNENSSSDRNPNEENSDNSAENNNSGEIVDSSEGITNPYEKNKEEEIQSPIKQEEEEKKNGEMEGKSEENGNKYELLGYLFEFLNGDKKLNVTSLGYFAKVVNALLNKRFLEILHYLTKNYEILQNMIRRMEYKSIGDILGRIILMDIPYLEDYNANNNMLFPDLRRKLIAEVLDKFAGSENHDELYNIQFILSELFNKYDRINYSRDLVEFFLQLEVECFFVCLKDEKSNKPTYALSFLTTLLQFFITKTEQQTQLKKPLPENNEETDKPPCVEINLQFFNSRLKGLLEAYASYILGILNLDPENIQTIETMFGEKIRPLKPLVMKEVEMLNLMLKIEGLDNLQTLISETDVFSTLWNLMISHEWNNLLHGRIEKTFITVLKSGNVKYLELLFEKASILDKIILDMDCLDFVMPGEHGRKLKKGYIGFITNISNEIVSLSLVDPYIKHQLKKNKNWENYQESILKKINSNNDRYLAGHDPRKANILDLNMDLKLPFYFEQKSHNNQETDENNDNEEDFNSREDQEPQKEAENIENDKALLMEDNFRSNLVAEGPNIEEIEENIPDDDKDPEEIEAHEPFCLKDHLEIEEFNEINEEKNKPEEEEISEFLPNHYWKIDFSRMKIEDLMKDLQP